MTPAPHIRPLRYLEDLGRRYPQAWAMAEKYQQDRRAGVIEWPTWCHVPIIFWEHVVKVQHGITSKFLTLSQYELGIDAGRLAALGAWRMTKGIYRFDTTLYQAVVDTPVTGDVPAEVLMRLPEWCIYVPTPGLTWHTDHPRPLHGFWAHLNSGRAHGPELHIVPDEEGEESETHAGFMLPIQGGTLTEVLEAYCDRYEAMEKAEGIAVAEEERARQRALVLRLRSSIEPLLSLLLFICAAAGDLGDERTQPANPEPQRTKKGLRFFAADGPKTWDVGARLGAALRTAYAAAAEGEQAGTGGRVRAHVRRAHWHGYWSGPKSEGAVRNFAVRWMPPIAINVQSPDELPAVVRSVHEG